MRIALTSPFAHPYVRRGAERYLHELAEWLASRGHRVTIVTSSPDRSSTSETPGGVVIAYRRRFPAIPLGRLSIDDLLGSAPAVARGLWRVDADVIQAHHYVDGLAVRFSPVGRRRPYILWLPGVAGRGALGGRPLHRAAFRAAASGAARVHTLSRYAAAALVEQTGVDSHVVPPGVMTSAYRRAQATEAGLVVCTAAAGDPRKRVGLLVEAFAEVARTRPGCRLLLAPPDPDAARRLVAAASADLRRRIEVVDVADAGALADIYSRAEVTVLPSVAEAFGLVVVESLAAGTPVVGTRDGAIPEILTDPGVGSLFERDDAADLARAILVGIDLASDAATAERCRRFARQWDWTVVGPQMEAIYEHLAA